MQQARAAPRDRSSGWVAFRHRDFALYCAARFISAIGTQVQTVAVGWLVYDLTRSALALGLVGLVGFLPAFGLALVTGHVADRFGRRAILLACYATSLLAALGLLLSALGGKGPVWPIYVLTFVIGAARAFANPAGQALVPNLVPAEHFGNAVAWNSSAWQTATIIGPAAGGLLYALGPAVVFGAAACCFALTLLLLVGISPRPGGARREPVSWASLVAGIGFIRSRPAILGAISLDLFAVLLGGATALLPIYARDILQTGPWGLGLLRSATAVGALGMALWLARHPLRGNAGRRMFAAVALFGVATITFGVSRSFALSLVALIALGASDMVSVVVRQSLVQLWTPDHMRGRVSAVNALFIGTSNQLGEFESGVTAAWLGVVPSVIVGGVGTLAIVVLWMRLFPALANVDRLEVPAAVATPRPHRR
jgi:MFS family permease